MDDVNIYIEELALEHPPPGCDRGGMDVRLPTDERLGMDVIAEIRRAVSVALTSGSAREA